MCRWILITTAYVIFSLSCKQEAPVQQPLPGELDWGSSAFGIGQRSSLHLRAVSAQAKEGPSEPDRPHRPRRDRPQVPARPLDFWADPPGLGCRYRRGPDGADAAFVGAESAPATWTVATKPTPQPSTTAQAKPADAAQKTFHFTNCNDAWASGQGAFKRGEPGYTEQLDPDGDGIACPTSPQR